MPSTSAAAGLKTALTGYGQSSAVRIGLAGWRWKSSGARVLRAAVSPALAPRLVRRGGGAGSPAVSSSSAARWKASVDSAPSLSFGRLVAEPVAAAAGREVVQRPLEAVAAEEPVERPRARDAVLGLAGDGERCELGLDERGCVERLLVAAAGRGLVACRPRVRSAAACPRRARLVAEPAERLEAVPVMSSRPSATPPTISACGSRALS